MFHSYSLLLDLYEMELAAKPSRANRRGKQMRITIPHHKGKQTESLKLIKTILSNAECRITNCVKIKGKETKIEAEKSMRGGRIHIRTWQDEEKKYVIELHFDPPSHFDPVSRRNSLKECREVSYFAREYILSLLERNRSYVVVNRRKVNF